MSHEQSGQRGFTLTEILLVVILISVIVTFSMTNYHRAMEQTRLADAVIALKMIHKAQQMYFVKHAEYYPGTEEDNHRPLAEINQALNVQFGGSDFNYVCSRGADPESFVCVATRIGNVYQVVLNQNALADGLNPQCQPLDGDCP